MTPIVEWLRAGGINIITQEQNRYLAKITCGDTVYCANLDEDSIHLYNYTAPMKLIHEFGATDGLMRLFCKGNIYIVTYLHDDAEGDGIYLIETTCASAFLYYADRMATYD